MPHITPDNPQAPQGSPDAGTPVRPVADLIARKFGESAVLIRLQTSGIYELNGTGARIWDLLAKGTPRQDIVETLHQEFDVDPASVSEAIDELIELLRKEGLIHNP